MRKWARRRLALPLLETRAAERLPSLWLLLLLMRLRLASDHHLSLAVMLEC